MNNRFMTGVIAVGLVLCGMGMSIASQTGNAKKLPLPEIGKEYTVGDLLGLIRTNNDGGTNFMIPTTDKAGAKFMALADVTTAVDVSSILGSRSAAGLPALDANLRVTLRAFTAADLTHLKKLMPKNQGLINQYQKIALYFVASVNGQMLPFFIGEPCLPGLMTLNMSGKVASPAGNVKGLQMLLRHWDFNTVFSPVVGHSPVVGQ